MKNKLSPHSFKCVFLDYSNNYKGYKCLSLTTNKIFISRHVLFDEIYFPFKEQSSSSSSQSSSITDFYPHLQLVILPSLPSTASFQHITPHSQPRPLPIPTSNYSLTTTSTHFIRVYQRRHHTPASLVPLPNRLILSLFHLIQC
jgi:hypothetical protein